VNRLESHEGLARQRPALALLAAAVLLMVFRDPDPETLAIASAILVAGLGLACRAWRKREEAARSRKAEAEEEIGFQRTLAELTLASLERDDLPATLALVCERARPLLGCDVMTIALLEGGVLVPRAAHPVADDIVLEPVRLGDVTSPAAAAARERRPVLAEERSTARWRLGSDLAARGVRRVLALPLIGRRGRVLGVLACGDGGAPRDLDAFRARGALIAAQAVAAVERVALTTRLQEESDRVGALLRVSHEIDRDLPGDETVATVCRLTRDLLRADAAEILAWDGQGHFAAPDGRPAAFAGVEEGRVLVAPLTHGERCSGLLVVRRTTIPERFGPGEVALLEGVARQCGTALDNLRLVREEQSATALSLMLLTVAQEFNLATDSSTLTERLAARATELTGAAIAVVAVRKPGQALFRVETAMGLPAERVDRLVGVELEDADLGPYLASAAGAELGGRHLSVPMERGGQCVGVLVLVWREGAAPTHGESAVALGLANQAAIALQTVRLVGDSREASRLKSEFVATMSHELRTPLNVITGYTDLLLEEAFGGLTPEQSGVLTRMQRSSRELLELITATLDLNRLEAGRSRVTLDTITVADLFAQLEAETSARLDRGTLEVRWSVADGLPTMETDPAKLRIILKNLIGNALKFTEHGNVTVSAEPADGAVVFTVADTGIGIRREDLPVIFEMFRQVESANTRRHGGVGLGLYIVKRLLAELRGEIQVESEAGSGSRFRVRVPVRLAGAAPPTSSPAGA
jgi:signal transduction histidine kinase